MHDGSGRFFVNELSFLHAYVRKQFSEEGVDLYTTAYSPLVSKCLVRRFG